MENARRYVQIYEDHPNQFLERKTFDLYLAVLRALCHIMQFFADDSIRKRLDYLYSVRNMLMNILQGNSSHQLGSNLLTRRSLSKAYKKLRSILQRLKKKPNSA
jgi:hypothetical protein